MCDEIARYRKPYQVQTGYLNYYYDVTKPEYSLEWEFHSGHDDAHQAHEAADKLSEKEEYVRVVAVDEGTVSKRLRG